MAAYAFTVDMDFDLKTAEDRALFFQTYDFKNHSTYYPVRVAGSVTTEGETYDAASRSFVPTTRVRQMEVGSPKLIRSGGSTFLFWREDGDTLKYLNVSELLQAKVPTLNKGMDWAAYTEEDLTWAVRPNGTFAIDARTDKAYEPRAVRVDFGSLLTESEIEITDYEVITDEEDNLYVVWTDTVTSDQTDPDTGEKHSVTAQEIYASALVRQPEKALSGTLENGDAITAAPQTARWSKPYRLTRSNEFNDGLALALDDDGGLIIVHNRYSKLTAKSEQEVVTLVEQGKIGLTQDRDGKYYAASLTYNSPVTLSVTRCDKTGSLEATYFEFSDAKPVANETVSVTAAIENVGLIDAEGCEIEFYECKNGVQMRKIGETFTSDETIQVNTAKKISFLWTVPAEGAEGCSIQAVIKEKRADGGYYADVKSYSETFTAAPEYSITVDEAVQDGDRFLVKYSVTNRGNAPAAEGTSVGIRLVGLYNDLDSSCYGYVKDAELYSAEIAEELPAKTADGTAINKSVFEDKQYVTIPASVFRYCGYDALQVVVTDKNGSVIEESGQKLVVMDRPMNLELNGGEPITLRAGESADAALTYDTTVFIEDGSVVYAVSDPGVAEVDETGTVTPVGNGRTVLTATLLPSGTRAEVPVTVSGIIDAEPEPEPLPAPAPAPAPAVTVEVSGDEGSVAVTATVEDGAAAIAAPTGEQMAAITGKAGETGAVTIDLGALPESITAVSIPAETVKAIDEAMTEGAGGLTIRLPDSAVTFDAEALAAIAAQTEGETLTLNVEPVPEEALSETQKAAVAGLNVQTVFDIYLTSGDERITDFGEGRARITVRHALAAGEQPGGVVAWYLPEEGGRVMLPTSVTEETVTFTVRSFSRCALSYDGTLPAACPKDETCPMTAFTDLDKRLWYHDGVHWALANGVMNGIGGGLFDPTGTTSRGMIVTMLHRMEGRPASEYELTFEDVQAGRWYAEAVRWAAENGIVNGYSAEAFGPDDPVTREQIVTILLRYAKYKGMDTAEGEMTPMEGFTDTGEISGWAVKAFRWAVDAGIINGVAADRLGPKEAAGRAQVATMLMRYDAMTE